MWRQHLFSKRIRNCNGKRDGFHTLTNENVDDYQFTKSVLSQESDFQGRTFAFIQDCGDRFYIGLDGKVADILGKDSRYASEQAITRQGLEKEKEREITFVHGYFAPKDTPIPDLEELVRSQPNDLEAILRRANSDAERAKADNGAEGIRAEPAEFNRPREKNTDWDRIATEFEQGQRQGQGMTFTVDGKAVHPLTPPKEQAQSASSATDEADAKKDPGFGRPAGEHPKFQPPRNHPYPISTSDRDKLARDLNRGGNMEADRKIKGQEKTGKPGSQQLTAGGVKGGIQKLAGWLKKWDVLANEADQKQRK